jgi:hypothetical protein
MEANHARASSRDSLCFSCEKMAAIKIYFEESIKKEVCFVFKPPNLPSYFELMEKAFELLGKEPGSIAALFCDGKYNSDV